MPIETGTKLGQYEVQDLIGQGAMGLVYRAYHAQLERTVAVKILQAIAPDPDTTARFRHEAQAIAQMRHPNILNVYDFGEYQGTPYMIVEYVSGGSLGNRLSIDRLEPKDAIRFLSGIAAGLDYAHGRGIVHRDIKPANVLLESDDSPVIADFGLAKLLQGSSLKSMTGVTTGTPAYMAPEQVTGSNVGPAADRYSLATMAYEMLTGVIPFDGEGMMEILYAQVHREPPPPSQRNHKLNPQVDAVILRGLAKDPKARWESCSAFVDALAAAFTPSTELAAPRTVLGTPSVEPTVPLVVPPTADLSATAVTPHTASSQPQPQRKSHRNLIAVIAAATLAVLLIAAGAGYLFTNRGPALALSESTVRAGETVVVSASRLPGNQVGQIELRSVPNIFPFTADANGEVSEPILVPRGIGTGDHVIQICWNSQCHASATLHVIDDLPPSPTPASSPSPNASPSPSPTVRTLALSANHIVVKTGTMSVRGFNYSPGKVATLTFIQGTTTNKTVATPTVGADGTFLQAYTIPPTAVVGPATIRACDSAGCAYVSFPVTAS